MRTWVTQVFAVDPITGIMELYSCDIDRIEAPTMELAQEWCDKNRPYLKVVGELIMDETTDYDKIKNN